MFGAIFTSFISVVFLVLITYGFIALYKKTSKTVFEKYPALSKSKGLISCVIIFFFLMAFVFLLVFIQEIFGISLL